MKLENRRQHSHNLPLPFTLPFTLIELLCILRPLLVYTLLRYDDKLVQTIFFQQYDFSVELLVQLLAFPGQFSHSHSNLSLAVCSFNFQCLNRIMQFQPGQRKRWSHPFDPWQRGRCLAPISEKVRTYTCLSILLATLNYWVRDRCVPTRPFHARLAR